MLIPAEAAKDATLGWVSMFEHSQIANISARAVIRDTGNAFGAEIPQNADMIDDDDKNGGPNHLKAWMSFRKVKGNQLAEALGGNVTPGMVSDLANSKRALSAKWLRRIAPLLRTTPGLLLDHDPHDLDSDIIEIWVSAGLREKQQISGAAKAIVGNTGTDG